MTIVEEKLCKDLNRSNGEGKTQCSGHKPRDHNGINCSNNSPTNRFQHAFTVRVITVGTYFIEFIN